MSTNIPIYLVVAALTIYAVRAFPITLIRREIRNPFIRSFLYYVPYVTLAVMTFPAILSATGSTFSAVAGFAVGLVLAWIDGNLFRVAIGSCAAVFAAELAVKLLVR